MNIILLIPPSPNKKRIIRNIDCSMETKGNYLWQPSDFMIITSRLEPEDNLVFIDGTRDAMLESEFFSDIDGIEGDILFFALSSVCWDSDYKYLKKIREKFKNTPIFVIGDIFVETIYQEFILKECDGIVLIPYKLDLKKMANIRNTTRDSLFPGLCTKIGQDVLGDGKTLDYYHATKKHNYPRHEVFLSKNYRFPFARHFLFSTVTTIWGCPFTCSYCTDSKIPPIVRPYNDVIEELYYLKELGVKEIFFADKTFGYPHKNSFPLLEKMAAEFNFTFCCYFHPQIYKSELLDLMKKAGCSTIIIGVDSANLPSLKRYSRNVKKQNIDRLLVKANELGIDVCADFILGLEHETYSEVESTINYAMSLSIDYASFNIAAPLPGSDIRQRAIKEGNMEFGKEGLDTLGRFGVLGNKNIDYNKLVTIRNKAVMKFYLRPSYLLKRLLKISSVEHFRIQAAEMFFLLKKSFF